MAKVLYGPVVSDARGKIGGVVATKSRFGSIIRKKVSPVQPRTASVRAIRANFTANAKAWSGTLSAAARQTFIALAAVLTKAGKLGEKYTMTGAQLYQSIARNLHTIGLGPLTTAPSDMSVSDLGGCLLAEVDPETSPLSGPGITVDTVNPPAAGEYVLITGAAPEPAGRAFVGKSKYRVLLTGEPGAGSPAFTLPVDISAAYTEKFGQMKAGQTIHLQVNNVNSANGAAGKPYPATITL
jgi:hypothetical protein